MKKPPPTITQRHMIEEMNRQLGTSYPVPATETEARFLIDGLLEEERKQKRHAAERREQLADATA